MGFTSLDDLVNEITVNGQFWRADWNKNVFPTTAQTAGTWYCLSAGAGNPGASTKLGGGTNLAFQAWTDADAGAIPHGGNVTPSTKHILNASAYSAAATTMPCVFMLVDLLGHYTITTTTSTASQTLDNTVTIPRYTTGAGVQAFIVPSTVYGAGAPTVTLTYTNSGGTGSKVTPSAPALPTETTTAPVGQVTYSGTGAGKYGPFIPLAAGDAGIRSVQSIQFSATHTSGVANLVLAKPLLTLPMTTVGVAAERDLVNQLPSMPRVFDGAHLAWMMYAGAATPVNSAFYGHLDFGWG
jgi:hypothetical protein